MAENKLQMPGVFGGLMRYDEEYKSRIVMSPGQVIGLIVVIIAFVLFLKIFWPVSV